MKPKVSVIVPIYNTENYLERCIKSLINQTLEDIEIILINDGSTDGSHNICEKYKNIYPQKIVYLNNRNIGCSATRNLGLEIAHADYIGFVDSDDFIDKDMYKDMYTKMQKENLDLVITGATYKYPNEKVIKIKLPTDDLKNYNALEEKNMVMLVWNKLFKKEIIEREKIRFLENFHYQEDLLFSFQYILNIEKIGAIKKPYYNYIQHGSNSVYNIDKRLGAFKIYEILFEYINKKEKDKLLKYYYDLFDLYVIGGTYMLLSDKKYITDKEYRRYKHIFFKEILNFKYISFFSKIKLFFWYILSSIIRRFNLKEKLLQIRRILRREV